MPKTISTKALSDFKLKFWKRETGSLWLSFEREKIIEFSKIKPNEKVSITGYVKWINRSTFALIPTLFSNQIILICINYTEERPTENAFIRISGKAKLEKLRPSKYQTHSNYYTANMIIEVFDWIYSKSDIKIPKSNLTYEDFKTNLTSRIEGLEPKIRDFLSFTAISSPAFYQNLGGVNMALYDSTKTGLPKKVLTELSQTIPEDIGKLNTIRTDYGRFAMRYKYSFQTDDADKTLSKQIKNRLNHKPSWGIPEYSETSLALFSSKDKPKTIEDPVFLVSDIPTVVPENTFINKSKYGMDQIDAFKFLVINHMKTPIIPEINPAQSIISNKLEKLAEDFDLDPTHISRYGFLNANYNAKPTSILRSCLSYARAQDIDKITSDQISRIFDDYFKWNFEYVYEIWNDLLAKPVIAGKRVASLKVKFRDIIRVIRKIYSSRQSGVSIEVIIEEAKTNPQETIRLVDECNKEGIIYQPVQGLYKLTIDE